MSTYRTHFWRSLFASCTVSCLLLTLVACGGSSGGGNDENADAPTRDGGVTLASGTSLAPNAWVIGDFSQRGVHTHDRAAATIELTPESELRGALAVGELLLCVDEADPFLVRIQSVMDGVITYEPAAMTDVFEDLDASGSVSLAATDELTVAADGNAAAIADSLVGETITLAYSEDVDGVLISVNGELSLGASIATTISGFSLQSATVAVEQQRDLSIDMFVPGDASGAIDFSRRLDTRSLGTHTLFPGLVVEAVLTIDVLVLGTADGAAVWTTTDSRTLSDTATYAAGMWSHQRSDSGVVAELSNLTLGGPSILDVTCIPTVELRFYGADGGPKVVENFRTWNWQDQTVASGARAGINFTNNLTMWPGNSAFIGGQNAPLVLASSTETLWSLGQPEVSIVDATAGNELRPFTWRAGQTFSFDVEISGVLPALTSGRRFILDNGGSDTLTAGFLTQVSSNDLPGGDELWRATMTIPATYTPGDTEVRAWFLDALTGVINSPWTSFFVVGPDEPAVVTFNELDPIALVEGDSQDIKVQMNLPASADDRVYLSLTTSPNAPVFDDFLDPPQTFNVLFDEGAREATLTITALVDALQEGTESTDLGLWDNGDPDFDTDPAALRPLTISDRSASFSGGDAITLREGDTRSFIVVLDAPAEAGDVVELTLSGGISEMDFNFNGTLTVPFAAGDTQAAVSLGAISDGADENLETGTISIAAVSSTGIVAGAIANRDLSIDDPTIAFDTDTPLRMIENRVGGQLRVILSAPAHGSETILLSGPVGGPDAADFGLSAIAIPVTAGATELVLDLMPVDDGDPEGGLESGTIELDFAVEGFTPGGGPISRPWSVDEGPRISFTSDDAVAMREGDTAGVSLVLNTPALPGGETYNVLMSNTDSLDAASDLGTSIFPVTFAGGSMTATLELAAVYDAMSEGQESAFLQLVTVSPTTIIPGSEDEREVVVNDPIIRWDTTPVSGIEGGSLVLSATIPLPAAGGESVRVIPGLGVQAADFSPDPITLTFAAGARSASATVTMVTDGMEEGTESGLFQISPVDNPFDSGPALAKTVTIDDGPSGPNMPPSAYDMELWSNTFMGLNAVVLATSDGDGDGLNLTKVGFTGTGDAQIVNGVLNYIPDPGALPPFSVELSFVADDGEDTGDTATALINVTGGLDHYLVGVTQQSGIGGALNFEIAAGDTRSDTIAISGTPVGVPSASVIETLGSQGTLDVSAWPTLVYSAPSSSGREQFLVEVVDGSERATVVVSYDVIQITWAGEIIDIWPGEASSSPHNTLVLPDGDVMTAATTGLAPADFGPVLASVDTLDAGQLAPAAGSVHFEAVISVAGEPQVLMRTDISTSNQDTLRWIDVASASVGNSVALNNASFLTEFSVVDTSLSSPFVVFRQDWIFSTAQYMRVTEHDSLTVGSVAPNENPDANGLRYQILGQVGVNDMIISGFHSSDGVSDATYQFRVVSFTSPSVTNQSTIAERNDLRFGTTLPPQRDGSRLLRAGLQEGTTAGLYNEPVIGSFTASGLSVTEVDLTVGGEALTSFQLFGQLASGDWLGIGRSFNYAGVYTWDGVNGTAPDFVASIGVLDAGDLHLPVISDGTAFFRVGSTRHQLGVFDGNTFDLLAVDEAASELLIYNVTSVSGGSVVFACDGENAGREPWISDGTVAGTRLLDDLMPGSDGSNPSDFVYDDSNDRLIFSAEMPIFGRELLILDLATLPLFSG